MNKIILFWENNKDAIKNITIAVLIPVATAGVLALMGVNRLNGIIDENDLNELFYGEEEA